MFRKTQGEPLKLDHAFAFVRLPSSWPLPWAGFLILAPGTSLSSTISQSFLKLMSIESVIPSNHFILCHSLFFLASIFPSIRVFSNESAKYWSFSFSVSLSNEYSGLISFSIKIHVLKLNRVKERVKLKVGQSCLILCDPMDCSLPVYGIIWTRILEWVAISFPRGSSWPRDWTWVFCLVGRFFTIWTTTEYLLK